MSELGDIVQNNKPYELNIGKSFQNSSKSFHHFKYDFTPASIDKNQEAKVTIGTKNDVTIQVPHVDGSAQKFTQFTGNKQTASTKECVLVYDTRTNEFTLERIQSNFILKRSRLEGSSKAAIITPRSVTPTNEIRKKKNETSNSNLIITQLDNKKFSNSASINSAQIKKEAIQTTKKENSPSKSNVSQIKTDQLFGDDLNLSDGSDSDNSEL